MWQGGQAILIRCGWIVWVTLYSVRECVSGRKRARERRENTAKAQNREVSLSPSLPPSLPPSLVYLYSVGECVERKKGT